MGLVAQELGLVAQERDLVAQVHMVLVAQELALVAQVELALVVLGLVAQQYQLEHQYFHRLESLGVELERRAVGRPTNKCQVLEYLDFIKVE